jgi:hypothetical protein
LARTRAAIRTVHTEMNRQDVARVIGWTPESRPTEAGPPGRLVRRTSACDPTARRPGWHHERIRVHERRALWESARPADTARNMSRAAAGDRGARAPAMRRRRLFRRAKDTLGLSSRQELESRELYRTQPGSRGACLASARHRPARKIRRRPEHRRNRGSKTAHRQLGPRGAPEIE